METARSCPTCPLDHPSTLKHYLRNKVILELEKIFNKNCFLLSNFDLLQPNNFVDYDINNRLLIEELNYDIQDLKKA